MKTLLATSLLSAVPLFAFGFALGRAHSAPPLPPSSLRENPSPVLHCAEAKPRRERSGSDLAATRHAHSYVIAIQRQDI